MANPAHHFMGYSHSSIFAILIIIGGNNDSVRDATIRNILSLLLFKIWWNHYKDHISRFNPSLSYWLTEKKTNRYVGLFLQKSFLSVEKWASCHLCSGTHLLTQSLNSESAHLRYVTVLEKLFFLLFLFHPVPSPREHWHSYSFRVKAHFCPLCAGQVEQEDLSPCTGAFEGSRAGSQPWISQWWGTERASASRTLQLGLLILLAEHLLESGEESWCLRQLMTSLPSPVGPPPALWCLCHPAWLMLQLHARICPHCELTADNGNFSL